MNDWYGNLTPGAAAVRFFHYGNSGGNNAIDVQYVGTIDTSGSFQPFSDGSDLNDRYNGDNVYKFAWWRNGEASDTCIAGYGNNANSVNAGCNLTGNEDVLWFAWSSESFLVSVGASNALYSVTRTADQPVWMGSNGQGNTGNGKNVYLSDSQANSLRWYFYENAG